MARGVDTSQIILLWTESRFLLGIAGYCFVIWFVGPGSDSFPFLGKLMEKQPKQVKDTTFLQVAGGTDGKENTDQLKT